MVGKKFLLGNVVNNKVEKIMQTLKQEIQELRQKLQPKLTVVTGDEILEIVSEKLGLLEAFTTIEMDRKYTVIKKPDLDSLFVADITTWRKYITDFYDCDNFSHVFKDWMDFLFGWSGIGVAYGKLYASGMLIGLHSFDLIAVFRENGDMDLLIYEPQAHAYTEAQQGAKIGNLSYVVDASEWY